MNSYFIHLISFQPRIFIYNVTGWLVTLSKQKLKKKSESQKHFLMHTKMCRGNIFIRRNKKSRNRQHTRDNSWFMEWTISGFGRTKKKEKEKLIKCSLHFCFRNAWTHGWIIEKVERTNYFFFIITILKESEKNWYSPKNKSENKRLFDLKIYLNVNSVRIYRRVKAILWRGYLKIYRNLDH